MFSLLSKARAAARHVVALGAIAALSCWLAPEVRAQTPVTPNFTPDAERKIELLRSGGDQITEVWIAAGQSQMLGVNFGRDASPGGVDRLPSNVYVLDTGDDIVPWHLPFETPEGALQGTYENLSPAVTFLKSRAEKFPNRTFLLVFVVRGASGFSLVDLPSQSWAVPGSVFYTPGNLADTLLDRIRLVRNRGWEPSGVLWLQGEADTLAGPSVYTFEFGLFRDAVRAAAGDPELPFLLGGIARFEWDIFPGGDQIDLALLGLAAADPFSWYVDTSDMVPQADGLHFDSPSTRLLGKRYASVVENQVGAILPDLAYLPGGIPLPPLYTPSADGIILTQAVGPRGVGVFPSYGVAASELRDFEAYRRKDGSFHLELIWPSGERVRWRQTSNPFFVERDVVNGFAYLSTSPNTYPPEVFGGLCRTAASGFVLSTRPGSVSLTTAGVGLYRIGAVEKLVELGGKDFFWTPGGVLVNSVRLRAITQ